MVWPWLGLRADAAGELTEAGGGAPDSPSTGEPPDGREPHQPEISVCSIQPLKFQGFSVKTVSLT